MKIKKQFKHWKKSLLITFSALAIFALIFLTPRVINDAPEQKAPYSINIFQETANNTNFRKVLFTGNNSQLVVMDIKPGDDVGEETHPHTEQTLFLLSGQGKTVLNGVETPFNPGDVVVVTPGTRHDFINTGTEDLKIFTMYSPANHIDGRIQKTKQDALLDTADEDFGNSVK